MEPIISFRDFSFQYRAQKEPTVRHINLDIMPGERVQIVDNNNGSRLETYVIAGERGSGVTCLNGAAARKVVVGDTVIIIAYALMTPEEAAGFEPKVVMVDENNRPVNVRGTEKEREIG